jgi:hypothetical protein
MEGYNGVLLNERTELVSPQTAAIYGLAVGHTLWGLYAYGDQLRGILRELPGSVGDGIFDKGHSRDARAAAFWFLFVGPMLGLFGRTYSAAERAGDAEAMRAAGRGVTAISLAGFAAIPRSGFPGGIALGLWLMRRARSRHRWARREHDGEVAVSS